MEEDRKEESYEWKEVERKTPKSGRRWRGRVLAVEKGRKEES